MSTNPLSTEANPADSTIHDARQRRTVLIAVCVALMAVIASVTGLNVAQPELQTSPTPPARASRSSPPG